MRGPTLTPAPQKDLLDQLLDRLADKLALRLKREEPPEARLLTPEATAKYLSKSTRWLRGAKARGELTPVKDEKGRPRYDREELDRWIKEHTGS